MNVKKTDNNLKKKLTETEMARIFWKTKKYTGYF